MKKNKIKKIFLLLTFLFLSFLSKAQNGFNFSRLDIGLSSGITHLYSDVETAKNTVPTFYSFNYNQTPFINFIVEAQFGNLEGGDKYKDISGRQFLSNYSAFAVRLQVQAGEFIDYSKNRGANALKGFYFAIGMGVLFNNINPANINRSSILNPALNYYTPGLDRSSNVYIPVGIGYEFKFFNSFDEPNIKLDVGYQYNYTFSDNLDGFKTGKSSDSFSQIMLGVKYSITGTNTYRKSIRF